jgi:hypothetical protein
MNKIACLLLIGSAIVASDYGYNGSTTAPVVIAGGIIKAKNTDNIQKYKRKDCPVCKGQGWYWSGDGIKKVDCGYCEPENKSEPQSNNQQTPNQPECKTRVIRK